VAWVRVRTRKIEGNFAVCTCDHLTSFSGDYVRPGAPGTGPNVDAVVVPPPEKDEDERDYVFWGCFNAFYIA
jgi:hypothetical protein